MGYISIAYIVNFEVDIDEVVCMKIKKRYYKYKTNYLQRLSNTHIIFLFCTKLFYKVL